VRGRAVDFSRVVAFFIFSWLGASCSAMAQAVPPSVDPGREPQRFEEAPRAKALPRIGDIQLPATIAPSNASTLKLDAPDTEGVPMPLLGRKVKILNTLAVASFPIFLALTVGLGANGIFAFPAAATAIPPVPGFSDGGHVLNVHGSHRDCQYGIYRQDGRRREGWHRYQDGDTYPCTPGSNSVTPGSRPGSSDRSNSRGSEGTDRGDLKSGGARSRDSDRASPSTPPSFGATQPEVKQTSSRKPARSTPSKKSGQGSGTKRKHH
jgi:hypothetical protein